MKAIFGGFVLVTVIIWALWSLSAKTDCEQTQRLASPVSLVSWGVREISENWVEREMRLSILVWSVETREFAEKLIARTFYSKDLRCNWSKADGQ